MVRTAVTRVRRRTAVADVVVASSEDVIVWRRGAGTSERTTTPTAAEFDFGALAISNDGRVFARAVRTDVELWTTTPLARVTTLRGHLGRVTSLEFSTDGTRLVSLAEGEVAYVWDVAAAMR